jgi:two-component system, NtrC family, sensor kinase
MAEISSWKIVLIDDEEDIRDVMTVALSDAGYDVLTAADGVIGLERCATFLPQIVITDIRMPGMNGLQVLEALKKRFPDIEVIVVTAFGEMELAIRALQLDASDFITKPVNDDALQLALKRARERYTSRKQLADYTGLLEKEKAETSQQLVKTITFQRNLIESSMDGILACDRSGLVVTFNRSMESISGYGREDVIGRMPLVRLFPEGEEGRILSALEGDGYGGKGRLTLYETTLLGAAGRSIPVQVSAAVLFDRGQEDGLVCFVRDLREIRKLEREIADQARILHQDKMMSLGRLAASVVHEINNPLSGILNYIRLMIRIVDRGPVDAEHHKKFRRYLTVVENETGRCSQIISSLLTFSRKSPPAFTTVNLAELIERSVILSQHKLELSNIRLTVAVSPGLPPVLGDFNQLQQCIINLIFNAIDAMPDGGRLDLTAGTDSDKQTVRIAVKDTGQGIAPEDQAHIFEPFFTTKKEGYGVGLGLSTVFGIVEHHKGTITFESKKGVGTTFTIHLPPAGQVK